MNNKTGKIEYLKSDYFADWQHPAVDEFARFAARGATSSKDIAINIYQIIRDQFYYNPFELYLTQNKYRASDFVTRASGNCIDKANLYVACARFHGIPSRYRFADVSNHLGSKKMQTILKSNIIAFHGMAEIFIDQRWIKVTPAFNKELCKKLNVETLDFNGVDDAVIQERDLAGNKFMEHVYDHGTFDILPYTLFIKTFFNHYPHLNNGNDYLTPSN